MMTNQQRYYRRHLEENRERGRANMRRRRARDPEAVRAYNRAWRAANPDKMRAHRRLDRERHREHIDAVIKAWKHAHKAEVDAYHHNKRAKRRGCVGSHTATEWREVVKRHRGRCVDCGDKKVTKDHVVPLSRGGTNYISNIVPRCRPCNSRKHAQQM